MYRKNVQGDITHIYTEIDGKLQLVAQYVYDAWGNHDVLDAKGNKVDPAANIIANINPFRYRGYYFDAQTGLYYLQTRYYDPELGRFISSDSIKYLDPQSLGGLNLYAYCGNNSVMGVDPTGTIDWGAVGRFIGGLVLGLVGGALVLTTISNSLITNPLATAVCEFGLTIGTYGALMLGSVFDSQIKDDMDNINWNPYNTDASKVLNMNKVFFYQGVPMIYDGTGGRSGTIGLTLLKDKKENTVKHEFGHVPQMIFTGIINYLLNIGIQSAYKLGPWAHDKNKYGEFGYYKAPWETMADMFGGINQWGTDKHTSKEKLYAVLHLVTTMFGGPLSYFFLLAD